MRPVRSKMGSTMVSTCTSSTMITTIPQHLAKAYTHAVIFGASYLQCQTPACGVQESRLRSKYSGHKPLVFPRICIRQRFSEFKSCNISTSHIKAWPAHALKLFRVCSRKDSPACSGGGSASPLFPPPEMAESVPEGGGEQATAWRLGDPPCSTFSTVDRMVRSGSDGAASILFRAGGRGREGGEHAPLGTGADSGPAANAASASAYALHPSLYSDWVIQKVANVLLGT